MSALCVLGILLYKTDSHWPFSTLQLPFVPQVALLRPLAFPSHLRLLPVPFCLPLPPKDLAEPIAQLPGPSRARPGIRFVPLHALGRLLCPHWRLRLPPDDPLQPFSQAVALVIQGQPWPA